MLDNKKPDSSISGGILPDGGAAQQLLEFLLTDKSNGGIFDSLRTYGNGKISSGLPSEAKPKNLPSKNVGKR